MTTWIVIKQWITSWESPTEYQWDGQHHPSHDQAVSAGFTTFECDDFNIGRVDDGQLVWFGWMDRELPDYDREAISRWIGLTVGAR